MTLEDSTAKQLRELAHDSGKSFKQVVNETLQAGLRPQGRPKPSKPYRLRTVSMGSPLPGIDLTKARQTADALEDEEIVAKMRLRK